MSGAWSVWNGMKLHRHHMQGKCHLQALAVSRMEYGDANSPARTLLPSIIHAALVRRVVADPK